MRRRRVTRIGGAGVVGLVAATSLLASVLSGPGTVTASTTAGPVAAIGLQPASSASPVATAPPWRLPADARPYIAAAGLSLHTGIPGGGFEVHLDIRADGHNLPVPAGVGEAILNGTLVGASGVFTTDTSGVVHVVGDGAGRFTLGQIFTEWGVPLSQTQLGSFTAGAGTRLVVAVGGKQVAADPTTIVLRRGEEIALWFGPTSSWPRLPSRYHFS